MTAANLLKAIDIKARFHALFQSEDGAGRLTTEDSAEAFAGFTKERVSNDNGILYLVEFLILCSQAGLLNDQDKAKFARLTTDLRQEHGLFNRHPGNRVTLEAHDSYLALVAGSSLFDLGLAKEIRDYGKSNWNCYNNLQPGKFDWRAYRQGGELALYDLCANQSPGLINWLWLLGKILTIAVTPKDTKTGNLHASTLLCWIRCVMIERSIKRNKWAFDIKVPFLVIRKLFRKKVKEKNTGIIQYLEQYFIKGHPIPEMAKLLGEDALWT